MVLYLIGPCILTNAQTLLDSLNTKIPVGLLKEDLKTLRSKLETSQPGLYLYTSKDSLDKIFDDINASFTEPLTSIEFFRRVAPLNGILKNLHTRIWPAAAYEKAMETILPRFPLDVHWQNDTLYVLRNNSNDAAIEAGSVIKSINGQSSQSVFNTIVNCRVRDGFNKTYPIAQASRNFSFYYAQMFGTPQTFTLDIITPTGTNKTIAVQGVEATQIHNSRAVKYKRKYSQYSEDWDAWIANKEPALQFTTQGDVGILTVKTFYLPIIEANGQKRYEEFFNNTFTQIILSNIRHLVIDLRNNHGGTDPVAMSLLSHLHDSVLYYYKQRTSYVKPLTKYLKRNNLYEVVGRGAWTGKIKPAKTIYKGKVYALINGYSVSAAGEFIGHLKNLNRAVFIGEEAGGNPVIFTGGVSLPVDLPHTRVTGTIPTQQVEMMVSIKNSGHGVIPDHNITPKIDEILRQKDVEMELALKLIAEQK